MPAECLDGGGRRPPYSRSDVASYSDIQESLAEVWSDCVYGAERPIGWTAFGASPATYRETPESIKDLTEGSLWVGKSQSIGVFMFGTHSKINEAIFRNWDLIQMKSSTTTT